MPALALGKDKAMFTNWLKYLVDIYLLSKFIFLFVVLDLSKHRSAINAEM